MDNRLAAAAGHRAADGGGAAAELERSAAAAHAVCAGQGGARSGPGQPVLLRGGHRALAAGVQPARLLGFCCRVLFMLRPLVDGWAELNWKPFVGWAINSLSGGHQRGAGGAGGAGAGLCGAGADGAEPERPLQPPWWRRYGGAGLYRARRGDRGRPVAARGWVQAVAPTPAWAAGSPPRCWGWCGPTGAVCGGGLAVGAEWLQPHTAEPGRIGSHAGHHRAGPPGGC